MGIERRKRETVSTEEALISASFIFAFYLTSFSKPGKLETETKREERL